MAQKDFCEAAGAIPRGADAWRFPDLSHGADADEKQVGRLMA